MKFGVTLATEKVIPRITQDLPRFVHKKAMISLQGMAVKCFCRVQYC